jgi:hypothetical protein
VLSALADEATAMAEISDASAALGTRLSVQGQTVWIDLKGS